MKIKLKKSNSVLPNTWKSCGASIDDWEDLHSGKEIEVKNIPESIKHLVDVSANKKKESK